MTRKKQFARIRKAAQQIKINKEEGYLMGMGSARLPDVLKILEDHEDQIATLNEEIARLKAGEFQ